VPIRWAVDLESFPSPAWSQSDSMSRIDRPLTNAPITIARSGSVRNTLVLHGNTFENERLGGLADLGDLDLELPLQRLHPARAKPVAQALPVAAQPALIVRPTLIARPPKPGVELVLHGALNDQPRTKPGQLRQRLTRVLADTQRKQLVDLLLYLRRRRYGASHGVGPPSSSCQDLREPTPCP
jgi:hypothetical protein